MGGLHFDITGDNKNLLKNLEGSKQGIRSLTETAEKESISLEDIMGRIGKAAAAIGLGFSATQLVKDVARVRGEFQQLEIAFGTMLGSEEKANDLFNQLVNTAAKTPFDLQGVAGGAKQLLAFGVEAEKVNETIIRLGDIAAGLSIPLGDLVYLYGTTMTQGQLFTQDLRQFQGRGIPLADELAKQFGVAKNEVGELVTAGKVGFPEVEKAIIAMTSEGGKFGGLMEKQSASISGQISNLEDAWDGMLNDIGKSTQGIISDTISLASTLVENYKKIGEAIGVAVTAYGSYKTAQMVGIAYKKVEMAMLKKAAALRLASAGSTTVLSKAEAMATARTELFTSATKKLTAALKAKTIAMMKNPYVLAAVAVTGLVVGIYKLATAKSAEEKAIEKVNKAREKANKDREEEKAIIDELLSTISDDSQTRTAQARAYQQLSEIMPSYTEALSQEEIHAMGAAEANKKLSEMVEKTDYLKARDDVKAYTKAIKEIESVGLQRASQATRDALAATGVEGRLNDKQALVVLRESLKDAKKNAELYEEVNIPIDVKVKVASKVQEKAKEAYETALQAFEEAKNNYKGSFDASVQKWEDVLPAEVINRLRVAEEVLARANKNLNDLNDSLSQDASKGNYGEAYDKAQKEWEDAYNKLQDAITNRSNYTVAEYNALVEAEKTAADAFKALGGDAKAKEKEKVKEQKEIDKDRIKLAKQTARELESIRGSELDKELSDIRANYEDRIEEINKLEKEWRKAQGGKLTSDQESTLANARSGAQAIRDSQEANARLEYQREIDDTMLSLKRETADDWLALDEDEHEQKMTSIQRDYEDRMSAIEELERELREKQGGTLTDEQTKEFDAARSSAQARRNHEEQQANKDALDNMLSEIITYNQKRQQVEEEYAKKRKELYIEDGVTLREGVTEANVANFDENRNKALQAVDEEFASKSESYQAWMDTIADMSLKQLGNTLEQAKAALATIEADGTSSEQDVAIARAKVNTLEGQIKSLQAKTGVGRRSIDEWKDLTDVLGEASSEFEQLGEEIGGVAGELLNSIGSIASTTVSMINNIVQLVEVSTQGTRQTASTAAAAIRAVETASVILAIISAAVQIIRKIVEMATKMHDGKYDKAIEANQKRVDSLEKSYENLEEAVDKAFGQKAVQTLKEMNANLEQQNRLINEQAEAEAEKKKAEEETIQSYRDKIEENQKQMAENQKAMEEAIFGNDIKSAIEGFADAYADAVANNMHMNESAAEQAKSAMKDMVQESIKEYIAGTGQMEKIRAKMKALYADGVFSEEDQRLIKAEYERLNNELDAKFAWAEELLTDTESSSSEGSTGRGIATASQESVDENNGRLMSIQVSMDGITSQMVSVVTNLANITRVSVDTNGILSDIRSLHVQSNGFLEDIVKYTKPLNDNILSVVEQLKKL